MTEPTEMKPKDGAPPKPQNPGEINLLCPHCGIPLNPLLRMYSTPIKGVHLVVYGCANCTKAINCALEPTALLQPSGLITDLSSLNRPS